MCFAFSRTRTLARARSLVFVWLVPHQLLCLYKTCIRGAHEIFKFAAKEATASSTKRSVNSNGDEFKHQQRDLAAKTDHEEFETNCRKSKANRSKR